MTELVSYNSNNLSAVVSLAGILKKFYRSEWLIVDIVKVMSLPERSFEKNGEQYKVRFFDANSFYDLKDLREIVQSPGVQSYMTSVRNMSHKHFSKWMSEKGQDDNFLLAITGKDLHRSEIERVHGFVYFYRSELIKGMLEISYAKRPSAPVGLMSPGVKAACQIVQEMKGNEPKIIAEIERVNEPSIVVVEKAGFIKYRNFDRYGNGLWIFDWGRLRGK